MGHFTGFPATEIDSEWSGDFGGKTRVGSEYFK